MFVSEKPSLFKNITNKPLFIRTEFRRRLLNRCDVPEFLAKIERMASSAQDAPLLHMISSGVFPALAGPIKRIASIGLIASSISCNITLALHMDRARVLKS